MFLFGYYSRPNTNQISMIEVEQYIEKLLQAKREASAQIVKQADNSTEQK
jgi:hypothetical protein